MYVRRTLAGEFVCINRHLLRDLIELGIWTPELKNIIVAHNGSVQKIATIPQHIKDLYKTVWEISQKTIIDMAADRGAYIDQSQSLNIHMINANYAKLTSMHFHAWKKGLKTGMYYLRTKAAVDAIKFTVDPNELKNNLEIAVTSDVNVSSTSSIHPQSVITYPSPVASPTLPSDVQYYPDVASSDISCSLDNAGECLSCGS